MAHFLSGLFVFLLLSFKSSLYILENRPLSENTFCTYFFLVYGLSSQSLEDPALLSSSKNSKIRALSSEHLWVCSLVQPVVGHSGGPGKHCAAQCRLGGASVDIMSDACPGFLKRIWGPVFPHPA